MGGEQRRPTPGWRKAAAPPTRATRADWRKRPQRPVAQRARRLKIAGIVAALVALNVALLLGFYWLSPPKPACLILVGAGYEENLAIPHNVYGWEGLQALAEFAQRSGTLAPSKWDSAPLRLREEPFRLVRGGDWGALLDGFSEPTVVIFLALHGACDSEGPYLWPHDADGRKEAQIRIRDVLARLEQLPARKNKVLLLDATQVEGAAALGVLHNDFARGLADLQERIEKIPNLIVLSASDAGQRSWPCEGRRRTIFTHYALEGLRGAADEGPSGDGNGRVDGLELHRYVRAEVERWVRRRRQARQTPVLLGGDERARSIELVGVTNRPTNSEGETPFEAPRELAEVGRRLARWRARTPPESYAPTLWQEYLDSLIRYEQLLRAGAQSGVDLVHKEMDRLEAELLRLERLPLTSERYTLTLQAALGSVEPLPATKADEMARTLLEAPSENAAKEWDAALRKTPTAQHGAVRLQIGARLLELTAERAAMYLAAAARLVPVLGFTGNDRPTELHFLVMLQRDLDSQLRPPEALLGKALALRRLAEQAALAVPGEATGLPGQATYSARIAPFTHDAIVSADEARRRGEDALFATDISSWARAESDFDRADQGYRAALANATALRAAFRMRDRAFAVLPALSRWGAARPSPADTDIKRLEDLWRLAHQLSQTLEAPRPEADSVAALVGKLQVALQTMTTAFTEHCRRLNAQRDMSVAHWRELEAALWVPWLEIDLRARLLAKADAWSRDDAINQNDTAISQETQNEELLAAAEARGRLALAALGQHAFDAERGHASFVQLAQQLRAARREDAWWLSLRTAGEEMGARFQAAVGPPRTPVDFLRRQRWQELLLAQAERVRLDHWAAEAPDAEPYHVTTATRYLRDASNLVEAGSRSARPNAVSRLEAELRKPARLVLRGPAELRLTSELEMPLSCTLTAEGGLPPGQATAWLVSGSGLRNLEAGRRSTDVGEKAAPVAAPFRVAVDPSGEPGTRETIVTTRALFRGQRLEQATRIRLYGPADVVARRRPIPPQAGIAVRAAPEVFERYAPEKGAVAIVLDCSNSMLQSEVVSRGKRYKGKTYKNYEELRKDYGPDTPCDYHDATDALEQLLRTLPAGMSVSVFAFGQRLPGETEPRRRDAKEAIRSYRSPAPWRAEELPALMGQLRRLEPWNRSPTLRAMRTAKQQGFPPGFRGFKTLLVLTDDEDNEFHHDAELNPTGKATARDFLQKEFADQGIAVRFVGYKVKAGDQPRFRDQLEKPFDQLPLGSDVLPVDRPEDLAASLQRALRRELRFQVERDGTPLPSMPAGGWPVRGGTSPDEWATLAPGQYQVRVLGERPVVRAVSLAPGDHLQLYLPADLSQLEPFRRGTSSGNGDISLSVWEQNDVTRGGARYVAALEPPKTAPPAPLSVFRPHHVWFEVSNQSQSTHWVNAPDYPGAAWIVRVASRDKKQSPRVTAWWSLKSASPIAFFPHTAGESFEKAFASPSQSLAGNAAEKVVLESVRLEEHADETTSAPRRRCLVVRLSHPPHLPVWIELDGLRSSVEEHRWYRAANKYAAFFWDVSKEDVRNLTGIKVMSLAAWKADPGTRRAELEPRAE